MISGNKEKRAFGESLVSVNCQVCIKQGKCGVVKNRRFLGLNSVFVLSRLTFLYKALMGAFLWFDSNSVNKKIKK
jgi:hypothetical protein